MKKIDAVFYLTFACREWEGAVWVEVIQEHLKEMGI